MGGAPSARRRKPTPDATPAGAPEEQAKKEADVSGEPTPSGEDKLESDVQQQVGQHPEDETQTDAAVDAGNVAEQDEEEMTFRATVLPSPAMRRLDGEDTVLDFIPGRPEHPAPTATATDAASADPAAAPAANTEETRRLDASATKTHYWCCLSSSSTATA